ncbi:hypothetical protein ANO11243_008860 [Dothideomycetidae sp. 11243]|nr:hypothetical protein ANO11243_008860 [fungal sp. No.11243]
MASSSILQALISESKSSTEAQPPFKFIVNSTIIQGLTDPRSAGTDSETANEKKVGRVGMHSAAGAYWNNEKDGMWSFKFQEAEGMDVVVSIMWVAV